MVELLSHSLSRMFHNISDSIEETKDQLSALDGAIGDADHGVTMSIGFQAVKAELSRRNVDAMAPADLMDTAAMAFLNSVGASTGPLYATGLRRAAQALAGAVDATPEIQAAIIKGIADGVRERGKGQRGDKTMLDAWIPAAEAAGAAVRRSATVGQLWREIGRRRRGGRGLDAFDDRVQGTSGATGRTGAWPCRSRRYKRRRDSQSNGADVLRERRRYVEERRSTERRASATRIRETETRRGRADGAAAVVR